jgi:hypothetical protein
MLMTSLYLMTGKNNNDIPCRLSTHQSHFISVNFSSQILRRRGSVIAYPSVCCRPSSTLTCSHKFGGLLLPQMSNDAAMGLHEEIFS